MTDDLKIFKKIVLFGIAGGSGFFIKDFIFLDLFSFKWTSAYGNVIDISLLTAILIGTFLSIGLWNRKAITFLSRIYQNVYAQMILQLSGRYGPVEELST